MKISKIATALKVAQLANDNIHMIGKHGIGKTEYVKQWAKENNCHIEILQLPILETSDLIGMPDITETENGKVTTFAAPEWLERMQEANKAGKHCIVFMDELGRSSMEIRQASLQIVLEKKVSEHALPVLDGIQTLCVVADNPSDEYDTAEFDMALEDRFQTYDVDEDIADWLEYARKVGVETVVTDFLAENPERLHFTPQSDGEKGSSPRAWKKLSDSLKANTDEDFVYSLITSKVGKTVGTSFFSFYNNYVSVVKPEEILEAIGDAKLDTEKQQRKAAEKLSKLVKGIEVISATELAEKLKAKAEKGEEGYTPAVLTVYLGALNLEVCASLVRKWKSGDKEMFDFYIKTLVAEMPNKWLLTDIIDVVIATEESEKK